MWVPAARIKHALPGVRVPTREEAERSLWFSPAPLGGRIAQRRTWVPAMVPWRAAESGEVTQDVLDWYGALAEGKPGVLVVEATGIRDVPSGPLLRIGDDRFVPGLAKLVDVVRERSEGRTLLLVQLIDFLQIRRRPKREEFIRRFLVITDRHRALLGDDPRARMLELDDLSGVLDERELEALERGARERVTDVDREHIRDLPRVLPSLFAEAAARAERAGFDGVELHYAHAYTMASFLSAKNTRDDGYGGAIENRVRLPREVLDAVRHRVRCIVGVRYLADEIIDGGNRVDDAIAIAIALSHADFLSLSRGGKFEDAAQPKVGEAAYPYTGQSGYECMPTFVSDERGPFGRNLEATAKVKRAVRTPIVAAGGIHSFDQAETILRNGDADFVAAARQSLADPMWFEKLRLGRGDEIRRCTYTNYCEALDQRHKAVTCKLWDRIDVEGRERRLVPPRWISS